MSNSSSSYRDTQTDLFGWKWLDEEFETETTLRTVEWSGYWFFYSGIKHVVGHPWKDVFITRGTLQVPIHFHIALFWLVDESGVEDVVVHR